MCTAAQSWNGMSQLSTDPVKVTSCIFCDSEWKYSDVQDFSDYFMDTFEKVCEKFETTWIRANL